MTGFPRFAWLAIMTAAPGVAQQPSHPDRPITQVVGSVKAISGKLISVATRAGMEDVVTDAHPEVWRGKTFHDLSPVQKACRSCRLQRCLPAQ